MVLTEAIQLNAGQNIIRFYEHTPGSYGQQGDVAYNALVDSLGVDDIYILADNNDFSTHFGTKESLVKWKLHIVDRIPAITHSIQDFKSLRKGGVLAECCGLLHIKPEHGVYLDDLVVVLSPQGEDSPPLPDQVS